VPSIFSDVAKAIDPKVRDTTGLSGFKKVSASLPFLSESLPEKKTIFAKPVQGEPWWSDILFGARVRTSTEDNLVKEVNRISTTVDKSITFTNWNTSSSKKLAQFREKIGSTQYQLATEEYGRELESLIRSAMQEPKYKTLSDEDKYTLLNGLDTDAMENVFKRHGFKYKQDKK